MANDIRCPKCQQRFPPGACDVVETISTPDPRGMMVLSPAPRGAWQQRHRHIDLSGPEYTSRQAALRCPRCWYVLPYGWERGESQIIALVGSSDSGKSHMIPAIVQSLRTSGVLPAIDCVGFNAANRFTADRYREVYYKPLFESRIALPRDQALGPASDERLEPLLFQMVMGSGANVYLAFYDAAGRDLDDPASVARQGDFVLNAAAIMFLVDPLGLDGLAEDIQARYGHLRIHSGEYAVDTWNTVARQYERYNRLAPGARLPIPVAVTLSKSDLLRFHIPGYIRDPPLFLQRPAYRRGFDPYEADAIHQSVAGIIDGLDRMRLLQTIKAEMHCFAVSATGCAPDAQDTFAVVEPLRCLDPLLWLLWRLGIIPAAAP